MVPLNLGNIFISNLLSQCFQTLTPIWTLVDVPGPPLPALSTHYTMTNISTSQWRVWSIYQKRHCQNFSKCHLMACLINLLNNGVDGVDGFYGFNGVFDNLPMCRAAEHHQKLLAPAASTEASLRLFLQLLLAWVAAGAQYRVSQQVPDTKNQPNKNSLF